jgi:mRNA interferase MazF
MEKDFDNWNCLKHHLNIKPNNPTFQNREIWWCSIGVNVRHEIDGKGELFSRPVLIVRKLNSRTFLGVPLTTQVKDKPHHHRIHFKEREQYAILSQLRFWDSQRLIKKMGKLPTDQFEEIRRELKAML